MILKHWRMQGATAPMLPTLIFADGQEIPFPTQGRRVLIFWATWCVPCEAELARIDRLVRRGALRAEDVFAISVDENAAIIKPVLQQRDYAFPVYWDRDGAWSRSFGVQGTPTLVFLDEDRTVNWMTMGISPSLELRMGYFLKSN